MANPDLPQEILLEIFSRLPAKCVGRCRCLSKSWHTRLSTTKFIKKHLITRQETTHQENLTLITAHDEVFIVTSPTRNDEVFGWNSFPDEWFKVVGSCNGLILLLGCEIGLLLVNPITLKQVIIQKRQDLESCAHIVYGIGHDCSADDYKLVTLSSFWLSKNDHELDTTFVDVYSLRTGVWKRIDYPYSELIPSRHQVGPFVNGAVHWFICRRQSGFRSCIAAFDLANEVFREIPIPTEFVRELGNDCRNFLTGPNRSNGLSVLGGCLSIVDNFDNGATDIWILKEYGVVESWVRFRIEAEGKWDSVTPLCFVEDEELLCLTNRDALFACDLKGGTVKKVILGGCDTWFCHGMAFVDSLVSPERSLLKDGETVAKY